MFKLVTSSYDHWSFSTYDSDDCMIWDQSDTVRSCYDKHSSIEIPKCVFTGCIGMLFHKKGLQSPHQFILLSL